MADSTLARASSSAGTKPRPTPYWPAGGSGKPATARRKRVGHLHGDAGAVTGGGLGPGRAPMVQVAERVQPELDDPVALATLDVDDERDTAGVVFEARVVEAAGTRLLVHHLLSHSWGGWLQGTALARLRWRAA